MSLILDALNRSRNESEPVPGLASQPLLPEEPRGGLVARLPWLALAVALLLIGWLVWDRWQAVPAKPVNSPARPQVDAPTPAGKPLEAQRLPEASVPDVSPASISTSAAKPLPVPPDRVSVRSSPAAVESGQGSRSTDTAAAVAQLYAAPRAVNKPGAGPKPASAPQSAAAPAAIKPVATGQAATKPAEKSQIDIDKLVALAEREKRSAELDEHPAPFIAALSQPIKDAIPTLLYERHDYNSVAGRSTVVINGQTLREGGTAAAGVKVDTILRDSVVLTHRGQEFRLRALNSWVNL